MLLLSVLLDPDVPVAAVSPCNAVSKAARISEVSDVLVPVDVPEAVVLDAVASAVEDNRLAMLVSRPVPADPAAGGGPGGGPRMRPTFGVPPSSLVLSLSLPVVAESWVRKAIMADDAPLPVLSTVAVVLSTVVAEELLTEALLASRMLLMSCAARLLLDPVTESDTAVFPLNLTTMWEFITQV